MLRFNKLTLTNLNMAKVGKRKKKTSKEIVEEVQKAEQDIIDKRDPIEQADLDRAMEEEQAEIKNYTTNQ